MSPDAAIDHAAIDHAARRFGTLAEQMGSGGIDRGRARVARQRLAAVAELLPPADRDLLRVVATPTKDGDLPGPSVIAARLGVTRQGAARRRTRFYRRIRRLTTTPPLPPLAPAGGLADHLADHGADPHCARRLALLLHRTRRDVAAAEGVSTRRLRVCVSRAAAHLRPGCPVCGAIAAHLTARRGGSPPG